MVHTLQPTQTSFEHVLGAGGGIDDDGFHRAGVHAPGFRALRAGVRGEAALVVEIEDLDARLGGVEHPFVLKRTGHLALQTAGALFRFELQRLEHQGSPRLRPFATDRIPNDRGA
jgi:hypothetical protein